ncbi:MAG: hypothetical protein NTX44_07910 [Ignavibacteriales bacterium]|nr:hypothetical protein [Ignavibacteriales bacterium]
MKKYFDWFRKRILPLLPLPSVLIMYFILRSYLAAQESSFNNWYGVALQIIGGFQLVWSIDTNLRGFKGQTIVQAIKRETIELFKSFPFWSKKNIVAITGTVEMTSAGMQANATVSHNYTELSDKVAFLERQLSYLENALDNCINDFHKKMNEQKVDFQEKIASINTTSSELKTLITDVAVGGIRGQITGFLIVVLGTIISAIQ